MGSWIMMEFFSKLARISWFNSIKAFGLVGFDIILDKSPWKWVSQKQL